MKLKILIVEDDLLLAEAVSDFFEGKGWEAEQVHDGMTAVEKTEAYSYQMILLDVTLLYNIAYVRLTCKFCVSCVITYCAGGYRKDIIFLYYYG